MGLIADGCQKNLHKYPWHNTCTTSSDTQVQKALQLSKFHLGTTNRYLVIAPLVPVDSLMQILGSGLLTRGSECMSWCPEKNQSDRLKVTSLSWWDLVVPLSPPMEQKQAPQTMANMAKPIPGLHLIKLFIFKEQGPLPWITNTPTPRGTAENWQRGREDKVESPLPDDLTWQATRWALRPR